MTFVPFSEASARSARNEQTVRSITKEKKKKIKTIKKHIKGSLSPPKGLRREEYRTRTEFKSKISSRDSPEI